MATREEKKIEEAKKISVQEAAAYSVMDGFGSRYVTPFANAMGVSNSYIGMLTSIPSLLGTLSQLFSTKAMERYSRQRIVFLSVLFQSLMWIALIFLGLAYFIFDLSRTNVSILLVLIYTILIVLGTFAGPAWSSWMKDLVVSGRGSYFGKRNRIAGTLALIFFFIGGFILDYFKQTKIFLAFVILFSLAFFGRFISAALFLKQYEPKLKLTKGYYFTFSEFVKKMPFNNFGRFVLFISLLNFSVALASPFFAIYLLENLNLKSIQFGYILYTIITMMVSVISIFFMASWGRFSDKYGNYKIMKITARFIPFIPIYWILSSFLIGRVPIWGIVLFFMFFEGISGWVWSGFNLSSGNYIYDAVTKERMALCVSYLNIFNGFGVFIGATLGGYIASINHSFLGISSLLIVFAISALARYIVIKVMISRIKEVRQIEIPSELKQEFKQDKLNHLKPEASSVKKFHIAYFLTALHNKIIKPRPGEN